MDFHRIPLIIVMGVLVNACLAAHGQPAGGVRTPPGRPTLENLLEDEIHSRLSALRTPPPARHAVPEPRAVSEAKHRISEAFADEFDKAAEQPGATSRRLCAAARHTEDSARQYALLQEAERIAAAGNQVTDAVAAAVQRSATFDLDPYTTVMATLGQWADPKKPIHADITMQAYSYCIAIARDAMESEAFDQSKAAILLAKKCVKTMEKSEKREAERLRRESRGMAKMPPPKTPARLQQIQEVDDTRGLRETAFQEYEKSRQRLELSPDDPESHRLVGTYLSFFKRNWNAGLEHLCHSEDASLRNASTRDLALEATSNPHDAMAVADLWWNLSETAKNPVHNRAMRERARHLYARVLPQLTDLVDRALAERRIAMEQ
jgi:hypothetical protein